jgi:hypothetical protein
VVALMAARRTKAARAAELLSVETGVKDRATATALGSIGRAVQGLQVQRARALVTFDLVVGTNRVPHGLGRAAVGYTITPTVADASFAHCLEEATDLEVWINVIGAAQPGAKIEVF